MISKILSSFTLALLLLLGHRSGNSAPEVAQNAPEGFNPGPDIITGAIGLAGGLQQWGSSGSQVGLAPSTSCCNAGNQFVNFFALPETNHPVIAHNLYRMSGGPDDADRFEQIGQSWVKHAFGAAADDTCFTCTPGGDLQHLGVGCADTYFAEQNATQSNLGSRALVNPFTGAFQSTASNHTGHTHTGTSHRLLVEGSDLNTTLNPGATYYAEVRYISSDEYAWCQGHPGQCNMFNNSSYRRYDVSGTTSFIFSPVGETVRMAPALNAWIGATISPPIEPEPGVDGRAFIAYKVTNPSAGVWHYEYAIYNENLDRAIQSFSVPLGCTTTLSNLGFHAPPNHPGFPNDGTLGDAGFSNAAWTSSQTTGSVSWSTETFAQNQNANAIRWGTLYNFRFDSDHEPLFTQATLGFFKTGPPTTVWILGPNACNAPPSPTPTATATATATPPSSTPIPTPPTSTPTPTPSPVPTPILPPGGNGKIAFQSFRDGNNEIYTMDPDGAHPTNLTNNPAQDSDPKWSPDGTKIAFSSTRNGHRQIYLMNANGSNPVRLTTTSQEDYDPCWSPDGTKIAFTRRAQSLGQDVYVMNADGSNQTRLTNAPDSYDPTWSPDGGKIAYTRYVDVFREAFVMDANGSNQVSLTNEPASFEHLAWSPDGTKIAYYWNASAVFVMSAYGGNRTRLTSGGFPAWSPDGTRIAFMSGEIRSFEIYVMDANGANRTSITNNFVADTKPDWQRIAALPPAPAAQALNLSTRMRVQTGENVGIGGFIISGSAAKHVLLRSIGPSLAQFGVANPLADPSMELHGPGAFVTLANNNWQDDPAQMAAIMATGIPPTNNLEAAIDATLDPGAYTAVVSGNNGASGVALVEVYDLSQAVGSKLANISTRALVGTENDILIAGFILGGNSGADRIVVRGLGPSLSSLGLANALADSILELRDGNGALLVANNNWQDDPAQAAEINSAGLAPTNALESAIAATLPPGLYTALLAGLNNGTGVGLIEVYDRGAP